MGFRTRLVLAVVVFQIKIISQFDLGRHNRNEILDTDVLAVASCLSATHSD
jgi:hypothetical protein